MSNTKEKNIKDEVCPYCRTGKAVVRFRPPKRYFWGCSFFPDCYGPKAWQSIQVPEQQRLECDEEFKESQKPLKETATKKEKKREVPSEAKEGIHDMKEDVVDRKCDVLEDREVAGMKKRK